MKQTTKFPIPSEIACKMVHAIEYATGDGILSDIRSQALKTGNSIPSRIWDILNTELIDTLTPSNCIVFTKRRGIWEMVIVYEKITQCIYTFMREERFSQLQKSLHKRKHMHYLDILTKAFNDTLPIASSQTSFLAPSVHSFDDEEELAQKAKELLSDLGSDAELVRHHILVLFDAEHCHLISVRAVMITPNMDIADGCEEDWSHYISFDVSTVVETVQAPEAPANSPSR